MEVGACVDRTRRRHMRVFCDELFVAKAVDSSVVFVHVGDVNAEFRI